MSTLSMSSALAHGDHSPAPKTNRVGPAAVLQLEEVREATSRYLDVDAAVADGYVDIGAFVPGMGWHYVNSARIDKHFNPERPEILVYVDDPCGGKRRLVAVEYAIPLPLSKKGPVGFIGRADLWHPDESLGRWTLHAWIWEYNPDGVFAPYNPRVP
jgi:hypothetical protein